MSPRFPRPRFPRPPKLRRPLWRGPTLRSPRRSGSPASAERSSLSSLSPLARYRLEQAAIGVGAALAGAAIAVALTLAVSGGEKSPAPAPEVVVSQPRVDEPEVPDSAARLGFPGFATRNTTRIAGEDPTVDAAGAALAAFPAGAGVDGPPAVSLVGPEDWTGALAASALVADPVGAPILVGDPDSVPDFTADAIAALDPAGSPATRRTQLFEFGDVEVPGGLRSRTVAGRDPAGAAAAAAGLRRSLAGRPEHIVLVSSDEPAFAMPAAAWAARSGDPVLFSQPDRIPDATARVLRRNRGVPVFVLGPETVISRSVVRELRDAGQQVSRIAGADPVANSIAFARFAEGTFGWDINDPGHGFAVANIDRPLDLAAAASVASRGKPGPLLLTDDPIAVPAALRGFLLDTKPGYFEDPARAVYNHIWLIGDATAMSVGFQVQIDELTNLERVRAGSGGSFTD